MACRLLKIRSLDSEIARGYLCTLLGMGDGERLCCWYLLGGNKNGKKICRCLSGSSLFDRGNKQEHAELCIMQGEQERQEICKLWRVRRSIPAVYEQQFRYHDAKQQEGENEAFKMETKIFMVGPFILIISTGDQHYWWKYWSYTYYKTVDIYI